MSTAAGVQQWQKRAVCYLETPDAPEVWTSDRRPRHLLRKELQRMCRRCPVQVECATEAVLTDAEAGTYAGVHLPEIRTSNTVRRAAALDELRVIAGLPSVAEEMQYLGVSA